jgi:putative hemolysin
MRKIVLLLAVIAVLIAGCTTWECSSDSECPQPLCPGVTTKCDFGKCTTVYPNGTLAKCENATLPNPSAKYCIDKGYRYEIETAADGSQRGYCYVRQSSIPFYEYKCDGWTFYRRECPSCNEFCKAMPHVECVGYWNITGQFPNCECQYVCSISNICSSDADCKSGYSCYNSRYCFPLPRGGLRCGNQEGDLFCHKLCNNNYDCPADMPYCMQVSITQGDVVTLKKMCMKEECKSDSDCPQPKCVGESAVVNVCTKGKCTMIASMPCNETEEMSRELCEENGGHWNECGSPCVGQPPDTPCIEVCVAQCECGGIDNLTCPSGYDCILPAEITGELGICTKPSQA